MCNAILVTHQVDVYPTIGSNLCPPIGGQGPYGPGLVMTTTSAGSPPTVLNRWPTDASK